MKKILKPLISVMVISAFSLSINIDKNVIANDITNKCEYDSKTKVNPDFSTMNCLLTETALKYDVPPEIVKAIAEGESGNWRHFDANGEAIVTADNGIGIMQITNQAGYVQEKLKNDLVYNIDAGVQILDDMFTERKDLPVINGGERDVLEHWYFAIMAYNGTKPVNSPIVQATGERNAKAYQERILRIIEEFSLVNIAELPFSREHFQYDSNSSENIKFTTMDFDFDLPLTKSKYQFKTNEEVIVTADNTRIRAIPSTTNNNPIGTLSKGDVLTITGPFEYDKDSTKKNHFVWYPVKTNSGTVGYVASSYLDYSTLTPESAIIFTDVPNGHYAKDPIYYLAERGILNVLSGVEQKTFGLGKGITRLETVLLINRAENVSKENRPDPGFTDVPKTYKYYDEIAAAVDEGIFMGNAEKQFEPDRILTRSEMAAVFQRLYKLPEPSRSHPFTDVKDEWFADAVARLYASGITKGVTNTQFRPYAIISREEFAALLVRSMDETYKSKN